MPIVPALETVIILQDLDLMIAEVNDAQSSKTIADMGFNIDNLDKLESARKELLEKLDDSILRLYNRLSRRYSHRVVPVQNNICLGCFMTQPTRFTDTGNTQLRTCQSCNRILYKI